MASPIRIAGPATYAAGSRRPDLQFDAEEEPSESNCTFSKTFRKLDTSQMHDFQAKAKFFIWSY